jgi:hypothetical protein
MIQQIFNMEVIESTPLRRKTKLDMLLLCWMKHLKREKYET